MGAGQVAGSAPGLRKMGKMGKNLPGQSQISYKTDRQTERQRDRQTAGYRQTDSQKIDRKALGQTVR